jgi:DNA processing protein
MSVDEAVFLKRDAFERARGDGGFAWQGPGLWSCGALDGLAQPCIAIVGTRAATAYGRRLALSFAKELGAAGCSIVSGLALGIDAAAHEGALEAGAPTFGVLGGGHSRLFPQRNRELAERMVTARGAVLSPWPPEHPALPHQFLERNAVVAALADAVVVIEAPARSGALNTANWAAGRIPVLAIPGDVDRRHVEGCHALIRDGAILARTPADVLEVLDIRFARQGRPVPDRAGLEGAILRALAQGECSLDELAEGGKQSTADLLAALALLEFEGLVERRGSRYAALV